MEFTLLDVSVGLVFWSTITFLLLLVILKKYLWKPLIDNLDNRERMINESIKNAEEIQKKSEESFEEYNAKLAEAREEVRKVISAGKDSAEKAKAEILEEANKRAAALIDKAKKEIEAEKTGALNEIKKVVVDISLAAAEKVIKSNIRSEDHMRLIEETMKSMAAKD
ncbi:MAG: F0F1 ATP synthase subunit B [Candidatus Marinimicrobia bacterium]|nr:F0F1 ATP synthase subunit B [Candidatus Neomarinimicrobiota bacterium]